MACAWMADRWVGSCMETYEHNIKVINDHRHRGYLEGEIDGMLWFAIVHEEPVETGIDPETMKRGMGRVTRLCIYQDSSSVDGNPYLPSMSIKRIVYVNYQREWSIFHYDFRSMTRELVKYLERRCCMHLLK